MGKPHVLYVEDEENDFLFMKLAFQRANISARLDQARDGREAIEKLALMATPADAAHRSGRPALVLLDLNLPMVSGFQVLQWLRGQKAYGDLPVVVISSSDRAEDKAQARALGANEYISKPGSGIQFVDIARELRDRWQALAVDNTPNTIN